MLTVKDKKRGVSEIIGYLLLVVFTVIIAGIVGLWLKSYVPADALNCPDGTSLFIKESSFDDSTEELKLVLKNNGRFDVAGFFIHATNSSTQETATIDLSNYSSNREVIFGNSVVYVPGSNSLSPGETGTSMFDIPAEIGEPSSVSIIPVRYQTEDNRERFVSCSNAKTESSVGEPGVENICIPESNTTTCGAAVCGSEINNCGELITCLPGCSGTDVCGGGICTPPIPDCGNGALNSGETCDDGNTASSDGCSGTCQVESGWGCTGTPSVCTLLCGNGVINTGEQCDDGDTTGGDGCSGTCQVESGWNCVGQPSECTLSGGGGSPTSCPSYCLSLGYGGIPEGSCRQNPNTCSNFGETYESGGNQWCTGGSQADTCCCKP